MYIIHLISIVLTDLLVKVYIGSKAHICSELPSNEFYPETLKTCVKLNLNLLSPTRLPIQISTQG